MPCKVRINYNLNPYNMYTHTCKSHTCVNLSTVPLRGNITLARNLHTLHSNA